MSNGGYLISELWSTADKLRLARQARREFLDRWVAGKLDGPSDDLDRLADDIEICGPQFECGMDGGRLFAE